MVVARPGRPLRRPCLDGAGPRPGDARRVGCAGRRAPRPATPRRADLTARFAGRLDFGTAGLRGELGAGPTRMNRVLVSPGRRRSRRIPADARRAASHRRDRLRRPPQLERLRPRHRRAHAGRGRAGHPAAPAAADAGARLRRAAPHACAGVMVTASAQSRRATTATRSTSAAMTAARRSCRPRTPRSPPQILRVARGSIADLPRSSAFDTRARERRRRVHRRDRRARRRRRRASRSSTRRCTASDSRPRARCSPMPVRRADPVDRAGPPGPRLPDRRFPEPRGARRDGPRVRAAGEVGADLVIANDPDADRVAVGVPDAGGSGGGAGSHRQRGRLAARLAGGAPAGATAASTGDARLLARLSPALGAMARPYRPRFAETLTGFKWISRRGGLVSATRRPSATSSTQTRCATRTASRPQSRVLELFAELKQAARRSSSTWPLRRAVRRFRVVADLDPRGRPVDIPDDGAAACRPPSTIGGIASTASTTSWTGFDGFPPNDILRFHLEGRRGHRASVGHRAEAQVLPRRASEHGNGAERPGGRRGGGGSRRRHARAAGGVGLGAGRGHRAARRVRLSARPRPGSRAPRRRSGSASRSTASESLKTLASRGDDRGGARRGTARPSTTRTGSLYGCPNGTGVASVTTESPSRSTSGPGRACASARPGAMTT